MVVQRRFTIGLGGHRVGGCRRVVVPMPARHAAAVTMPMDVARQYGGIASGREVERVAVECRHISEAVVMAVLVPVRVIVSEGTRSSFHPESAIQPPNPISARLDQVSTRFPKRCATASPASQAMSAITKVEATWPLPASAAARAVSACD